MDAGMKTPTPILMDIDQHAALPFPQSLPPQGSGCLQYALALNTCEEWPPDRIKAMTMLNYVAWFAIVMSAVNWLLFFLLTLLSDLPQLRRLFDKMLSPSTEKGEVQRDQLQSGIDPTKIAAATGSLAGAFKKAGPAPTAAALSVLYLLIAVIAAGVGKF
jgi:hypothetical protein